MDIKLDLNSAGYVKQRETETLEFKQSFQYGDTLLEYLRTLVGMANNKGGAIIFGVQDKPRLPIGLLNDKFENCDPTKITRLVKENLSHEIDWRMEVIELFGRKFGVMEVIESEKKPVICKKNNGIIREAAIYFRYRGVTSEIRFEELDFIISKEKNQVSTQWMNLFEKIGKIGVGNVNLIDSFKGEIHTGNIKLLVEKDLIDRINVIKKGKLVESGGEPAYTLVGELTTFQDINSTPNPDSLYSLRGVDICREFSCNQFQLKAIFWKLNI